MAAFQVDLGERSKRACFTMARILAEELSHFVIEDGARRIVVDTCVGISKDRPQIPEFDTSIDRFSPTLLQRASPPDAVDTVVCTHLHVDHVGWNTLPDQPRHALLPERTGRAAHGFGKLLREASVFPIYDGGNMGMQRRRVHGLLADAQFNPRAIMEDEYVKFDKHHEAIDTIVS